GEEHVVVVEKVEPFATCLGKREVAGARAPDLLSGGLIANDEPPPELIDDRTRGRRAVLDHDCLDVGPRLLRNRLERLPQPRAAPDRADQDRYERRIASRTLAFRAKRNERPVAPDLVAPPGENRPEPRRHTHARQHEMRPLRQEAPQRLDETATTPGELLRREYFAPEHRQALQRAHHTAVARPQA